MPYRKTSLVLPVQGAPLVFSTTIAHDFVLRVPVANGQTIDLPATADAAHGGFTIDIHPLPPGTPKITGQGDTSRLLGIRIVRRSKFQSACGDHGAVDDFSRGPQRAHRRPGRYPAPQIGMCRVRGSSND